MSLLAHHHRADAHGNQHQGQDGRGNLQFDEVNLRFAPPVQHVQRGDEAAVLGDVEDHARHKDRGVHAHQDAEDQSHREALELLSADDVQHDRGNQRGHVRVDDSRHRAGKAVANRHPQRGARAPTLREYARKSARSRRRTYPR